MTTLHVDVDVDKSLSPRSDGPLCCHEIKTGDDSSVAIPPSASHRKLT